MKAPLTTIEKQSDMIVKMIIGVQANFSCTVMPFSENSLMAGILYDKKF
ncbi:hypothetical protein [Thorsellia anophelis]|nr:hypothetical protein [Thorsellia anophelis]